LGEIVLWLVLALAALAVIARVRSLLRPTAFPPWMTPLLEVPWRRLDRVVERSGVAPGERVLEVGPGGGAISEVALARIGPAGRLVCLDLQIDMLRKVRARLGPRSPLLVQASGSALPFRSGVFDRCFLVSVLGEIPDKNGAMAELRRVLRPGGVLAVTEGLPDPDYVRTPVLLRLAGAAGFQAAERFGNFVQFTQRFATSASPASSRQLD
jgi:ubiquinone/menaquinone biosynthesis C-methylase UbiE